MTKVMRFFLYTSEPLRARSHKVRQYTKKASAKQMPICEVSMMARGGRHPFYFRYSAILSNNISSAGSHFTDLNVS